MSMRAKTIDDMVVVLIVMLLGMVTVVVAEILTLDDLWGALTLMAIFSDPLRLFAKGPRTAVFTYSLGVAAASLPLSIVVVHGALFSKFWPVFPLCMLVLLLPSWRMRKLMEVRTSVRWLYQRHRWLYAPRPKA